MPAPARVFPEYDNAFLAHADRARIVSEDDRRRATALGGSPFLVDGFVAGSWKLCRGRRDAVLEIEPYRRLRAADRTAVTEEAERLLAFLAPDASTAAVRLRDPS